MRYGKLKLLEKEGLAKKKHKCICDCGNITYVNLNNLRNGHTKSCGCLQRKLASKKAKTHGMSKTPEYRAYYLMKNRCYNKNYYLYHRYGGRGIDVCERWLESFENFYLDMGCRPSKNHSLDRIDNNKGYSPLNCRWATNEEQNRNKSNTIMIEINGLVKSLPEWCDEFGVNRNSVRTRIKRGWNPSDAVTTPF